MTSPEENFKERKKKWPFISPFIPRWQHGVLWQWTETPLSPILLLCQWDGLNDFQPFLRSDHLASPHLTALSEDRGPKPSSSQQSSAEAVFGCNSRHLQITFSRKKEIRDDIPVWPLKTDHGDNTTVHFLVVYYYTEQATIHRNEWGDVAMHNLRYCYKSDFFFFFINTIWCHHNHVS